MSEYRIPAIDDFHVHLRDGVALATTVPAAARQCQRALVMPNLVPPVTTVDAALAYRERILQHVPAGFTFEPLMTLYLTDDMPREELAKASANPHIVAVKLYPAGATTNSDAGVSDLRTLDNIFSAMEEFDIPLCIHGEVTDHAIDIFDREQAFIERHLTRLITDFPRLRIILEHITTAAAVEFVRQGPKQLAATITAHHLWLNRNDLLVGGIKPHHYCLPIVKRSSDQLALINAATSGHPRFFLGSDSAPHAVSQKQSACGCAGIYTGHALMSYYATVFASENKLERLADFSSSYGADFYRLPRNTNSHTLRQTDITIPEHIAYGDGELIPFLAGKQLEWDWLVANA